MHAFAYRDNEKVASATVSNLLSAGSLYGKGVFTTVRLDSGRPFLWGKHWRRLTSNAAAIGIAIDGYTSEKTLDALSELIEVNDLSEGRARITFFDQRPGGLWVGGKIHCKTGMLIITSEHRSLPACLRLTTSPFPINSSSPLAGVKSCNYLEQLLSFETAKNAGFDEAVRVNERGEITSACMANIFWIKGGRVITPSLETGCLAGTTREFLLENMVCDEVRAELKVLDEAESIFLTSAGLGIAAAATYNGRHLAPLPDEIRDLVR